MTSRREGLALSVSEPHHTLVIVYLANLRGRRRRRGQIYELSADALYESPSG
jgi:hypothetical protein